MYFSSKNGYCSQRYRIFFFRGKVWPPLTHSFLENFVFFFRIFGKKKTDVFFFSQEKFESHSLGWKTAPLEKQVFLHFCGVFFFSNKKVFFFSQEKFTTHSLTRSQGPEKKKQGRKKKTAFLLTYSKNHKKVQILNFSGEKKYGTFDQIPKISFHSFQNIKGPLLSLRRL